MGHGSSKFLKDVDFTQTREADLNKIMDYFKAEQKVGTKRALDSQQARRFLQKLCKYKAVNPARAEGFVTHVMERLDANKDGKLDFDELSVPELWQDVMQLAAKSRQADDATWKLLLDADKKKGQQQTDGRASQAPKASPEKQSAVQPASAPQPSSPSVPTPATSPSSSASTPSPKPTEHSPSSSERSDTSPEPQRAATEKPLKESTPTMVYSTSLTPQLIVSPPTAATSATASKSQTLPLGSSAAGAPVRQTSAGASMRVDTKDAPKYATSMLSPKPSSKDDEKRSGPIFHEGDQGAEDFWNGLPDLKGENCDYNTFVDALTEVWDCAQTQTVHICYLLVPPVSVNNEQVVRLHDFAHFVRSLGPWATGKKNRMLQHILDNFFDAQQALPYFHSHINSKRAESLLKKPGDFLYRYSSRSDGICVTRYSGKGGIVSENVKNMRDGKWEVTLASGGTVIINNLSELMTVALKDKLLNAVLPGEQPGAKPAMSSGAGMYSAALYDPNLGGGPTPHTDEYYVKGKKGLDREKSGSMSEAPLPESGKPGQKKAPEPERFYAHSMGK